MFKCRLLLLFVGVFCLGGGDSYTYISPTIFTSGGDSYGGGYGYAPQAQSAYGYSPAGYGYQKPPANYDYLTVIEVLDKIFCNYADRKRFSSTIYPYMKQVAEQYAWVREMVIVPKVYNSLTMCYHTFEMLLDSMKSNMADCSLLDSYDAGAVRPLGTEGTASAGTESTQGKGTPTVNEKQEEHKQNFNKATDNAQTFKKTMGVNLNPEATTQKPSVPTPPNHSGSKTNSRPSNHASKTTSVTVTQTEMRSRSMDEEPADMSGEQSEATPGPYDEYVAEDSRRRRHAQISSLLSQARVARNATFSSRKPRSAYVDYTCSYMPPYGPTGYDDKYDELLFNIVQQLFLIEFYAIEALNLMWDYMTRIENDSMDPDDPFLYEFNFEDLQAYREACMVYGAILTPTYSLFDITDYVLRYLFLVTLDQGSDGSSYRSAADDEEAQLPDASEYYYGAMPPAPADSYSPIYPPMTPDNFQYLISQVNQQPTAGYTVPQMTSPAQSPTYSPAAAAGYPSYPNGPVSILPAPLNSIPAVPSTSQIQTPSRYARGSVVASPRVQRAAVSPRIPQYVVFG